MHLPAPPLPTKDGGGSARAGTGAADARTTDGGRPAHRSYHSQMSNGGVGEASASSAAEAAALFSFPPPSAAVQSDHPGKKGMLERQPHPINNAGAHDVHSGGANSGPISSPLSCAQSSSNSTTREHYGYYGNKTIYDPSYDQQHAERIEERYDKSYQERIDRSYEDSFHEEVAPATPSSAAKRKLMPSVVSIAQKLLPTVMKRLGQHDSVRTETDDFQGICSPLGSPTTEPKKFAGTASSFISSLSTPNNNLKTTGLDESDYRDGGCRPEEERTAALEAGDGTAANEAEITEYLPQSAALLVNALQGSANKINGYGGKERISFDNLPNLVDDVSAAEFFGGNTQNASATKGNDTSGFAGSPPLRRLQSMEKEAEALLDSIRRDEIGTGSPQGGTLRYRRSPSGRSSGGSEDLDSSIRSDDDESSMSGDMVRLSRSIAHLQRDLENIDFSHLDNIHDDAFGAVGGDMGSYDGESGMLTRMKLWFSRGMIMEQKLLNTYVNPSDGGDGGAATQSSGRYMDNPVLIWSLALMWAFVALILMNPKIAELVEGGDAGQLADIIEWLFG